MRPLFFTPAIVLRSWPFGESDKIVSFLTEAHGKVVGIAKGAKRSRKRFVNTLEPFSLIHLRFQDRPHSSLAFIQSCDLMRAYKALTTSLERFAYGSHLMEITEGLATEREENRPLFDHLRDGLTFIEERGTSLAFLTFFELRLLKLVGYQPMLERCRRCGKDWRLGTAMRWRFGPRDGGILCDSCSTFRKEAVPLSRDALAVLTSLQKATDILSYDLTSPAALLQEGRAALLRFIQYQLNRELKSAPFIEIFSSA